MLCSLLTKGYDSIQSLSEWGRQVGLVKKMEGSNGTMQTIDKMLKNPFYIGWFTWKGKDYQHRYETFIPEDLWHKVQSVRKSRSSSKRKYKTLLFTLSGICSCETCGSAVSGYQTSKGYVYYRCSNKRCDLYKKNVSEVTAHEQILDTFKKMTLKPDKKHILLSVAKSHVKEQNEYLHAENRRLTNEKMLVQDRLNKLNELVLDGKMEALEYQALKGKLQSDMLRVEGNLTNLHANITDLDLHVETVISLVNNLSVRFSTANEQQKNALVRAVFQYVHLTPHGLRFYLAEVVGKMFDVIFWSG